MADRIPTKTNLLTRGIIQQGQQFCLFCNMEQETTSRLLFTCQFSYQVWMKCYQWLGASMVLSYDPKEHLLNHYGLFAGKNIIKGGGTIWAIVAWTLWLHRNKIIFQAVVDLSITHGWSWIRAKTSKVFHFFMIGIGNPLFGLKP